MSKRKVLGKGLEALLPQKSLDASICVLDVSEIEPNPLQPRLQFDQAKLRELADSLAENGLLQPIVVRKTSGGFEIIAGERRWRAAQLADLKEIPALVRNVSDQEMLELALVENLQRDELSPIEEAHAYRVLMEDFDLTQQEVAQRVGRSRSAVANSLRLLNLPQELQLMVLEESITMGHARALLPLPRARQLELAREIESKALSVRATEQKVQHLLRPPVESPSRKDPNIASAEAQLEERWKTKVNIWTQKRGSGKIVFHYHSQEELDRLFEALLGVAAI